MKSYKMMKVSKFLTGLKTIVLRCERYYQKTGVISRLYVTFFFNLIIFIEKNISYLLAIETMKIRKIKHTLFS
jgi:hypothetical protein